MGGIIKINAYNTEEIVKAMDSVIVMSNKERE